MLSWLQSSSNQQSSQDDLLFDLTSEGDVSRRPMTAGIASTTLLNLRWLAILGQIAAILFVHQYLNFDLPLLPLGAGVLASVLFNTAMHVLFRSRQHLSSRQSGLQLVFDQLQLAFLLYLTGGLLNPFAVMMLLPLTISATMLSGRATVFMLALTAACLLVLTRLHLPLPWAANETIYLPPTYQLGLWAGIAITMIFIAAYAYRVSADARKRAQSIVALQAALGREHRLSAVGSLAAAAAHELGTPLGTISLVSKDLQRHLQTYPELAEDFKLLESQSERCRDILADISKRSDTDSTHFQRMPIAAVIEEIVQTYQGRTVDVRLTAGPMPGGEMRSPVVARAPELRHGVANFLSNAVRFAQTLVEIDVTWDATDIHIVVSDDGPGFSDDVISQLGKPFLGSEPGRDGETGMGLGVFIAATLLGRTGAHIVFENDETGGAVVDITWDRERIEERGDTWDTQQHSHKT